MLPNLVSQFYSLTEAWALVCQNLLSPLHHVSGLMHGPNPLSAAHRRSRASFGRFLHSSSRSQTSSNICHADTRDESVAVAHPISTRCQCLEARHSTGFSLRGSNRFEVIKRSHPQDYSINLFTPVSTLFTSTVTVYKVYTL